MRYLFGLLLLMGAQRSWAQPIVVEGVVTDATTGDPLVAVTVVNTRSQAAVYTDMNGAFRFSVFSTDQIVFTMVGYKPFKAYASALTPHITLERSSYSLNEVIVRPGFTEYQRDSLMRHSTYQRTLAYNPVGSVMSPVSALAEVFSKKRKMRMRFQQDFYSWENTRFIDSRYTPDLVTQMTHLEGDTLASFMNSYPMPADYARAASELEIKMWIRTNYRDWIAKGRPVLHIQAMDSMDTH